MFTRADLRRSLTAKVLLGLMLLGLCVVAIYTGVRLLDIEKAVTEREGPRSLLLAEPMRFALEGLAERHPEITTQTERLQRLVEHMAKTRGITSVAVMDASGRRALAASGNPELLRGVGGDLPQRTLSMNQPLAEGTPRGRALLVAIPLHRQPVGGNPPEAFGVLVVQHDLTGPIAERQRQSLRDSGVMSVGLLLMLLVVLLGLRISILEPVSRLAAQAAALGGGDLTARSGLALPPGGGDEIERLAAGFDQMAAELEAAAVAQARLHDDLRASEARGRAVFRHASVAISQGDRDGRILDANPAFLRLWGYTLEELKGVRWIDLTHPDDRAQSIHESQRLLAGESDGFNLEKRYVRRDGRIVWASVNVACLRDENGLVQMLVLVAEDITARKAAEEAKAEREELFQAMFENNLAVQLLVDPATGAIIDANRSASAFYGYSQQQLRNMGIGDINTLAPEEIGHRMAEAERQGAVFHFLHRLKDKSLRDVEVRSGPFKVGGRALLLSTIQDITERLRAEEALQETEERLRQLVDLMDEGVVLTSPEGTLRYVNPAVSRMVGMPSAELVGRSHFELLAPGNAEAQRERLEARRQGSREPYEARFLRKDGSEVLVRVTPFPLFSHEGEYQGSCGIIRDITQARAREEADNLRRIRRSALLRLHEMHNVGRDDLLDFALEQVQVLTASPLGYIYAYDDVRRQFTLHSWSAGAMEQCNMQHKPTRYDLDATGIWGDAVRLREPILVNDFAAPDPRKKGLPEGHAPLSRFLTLPVIRAGRVVAVVGVGNKQAPYLDEDITQLKLFTDALWSMLERQEALAQLSAVNERFHLAVRAGRIGLWDWNLLSGAMHCDAYMEKSFGLSQRDLTGTPEDWLCRVHPEDRPRVRESLEMARATGDRFEQSFRVLWSDGSVLHMDSLAVTYLGQDDQPLRMVGVNIDVTSQRQAEEQVAESQRFLQTVIDTLPMPFTCKDAEGRYLLANAPFARLYGASVADVLGKSMHEFAPPERTALHVSMDAQLLASSQGKPLEYETSFAPLGESLHHWLVVKSLLPLSGGRKPGIAAITLDITERKQAEEALQKSEKRSRDLATMLRLMCDNVPDMIWAKDMEKRFLFANKALCEGLLNATDTSEPEGKSDLFFAQRERESHPGDSSWHTFGELCQDSDTVVMSRGEPGQFNEFGNVKGKFLYLDVRKAPFVDDQGEVIGTVGSARDITDQKRAEDDMRTSEERFRTLTQLSPVGIFQADLRGRCTYVNDQWSAISGFPKASALGRGWLRTLYPQDRKRVLAGFRELVRTGQDFVVEFRFRPTDAPAKWILLHTALDRAADGEYSGFVGALTDITEQKHAEVALRQAKAAAEAATLTKAQFLANMSHEIRTPLGGVIGASKLLAQSKLSADQRQLAEMAVESGRALLAIVNDILDFSKIEAGRLDLKPAPFALRADLEAVAAPFRLLASQRGLDLNLVVDLNTPDTLVGDSGRLDQVLRNLLGNAVKFTEAGTVTLQVATDPSCSMPKSAACIRFTVRDTGSGIPENFLPHLFESFSQADESFGKRHGGTGLGLAISRSLVERMGGNLEVESTLGVGSAFGFTLCLPLASQDQLLADPEAEASPRTPQARRLRVLLADDNEIGRILLERILKDAGHSAISVGDGLAVLAALKRERFDLVLMDVQMPEVDGLAATQMIRKGEAGAQNANVPIVALTAYAQAEDRARFVAAGMDEYVPKPVEERDLLSAMRRAMSLRPGQGDAPETPRASAAPGPYDPAKSPRFDLGFLERSYGERSELLTDMLAQFHTKSLPEIEGNLRQALSDGNMHKAQRVAHKARGTFGTVGARRAVLLAQAAEKHAVEGDAEALRNDADALLVEIAALDEHLRQGRPWPDKDEG
ncbi:MAG: PAS domain S-box protein [Proteobacteria bacterium]|nr:PAS domain S-box protein [Pseudomonadota bacterium]